MQRFIGVLAIAISTTMMTACTPGPGGGLGPEHAGVAGGAMAASAQGTLAFAAFDPAVQPDDDKIENGVSIQYPMSQFQELVGIDAQGLGGGACSTVSGDPTDDDEGVGDGIPVDITHTFNCSSTVGDTTFTFTGDQYLRDTLPAVVSALNFEAGQDAVTLSAVYPAGNSSLSESWSVAASAVGLDMGLDTDASISGQLTRNLEGGGTRTNDFLVSHDFDASVVLLPGDATISGMWSIDVNEISQGNVTVNTVPTVHINITCPTLIDAGVIEGTYTNASGGVDVLTVTWSACGVFETELNGTVVEPEGPVAGGSDS